MPVSVNRTGYLVTYAIPVSEDIPYNTAKWSRFARVRR
jgi:hypothetical protein